MAKKIVTILFLFVFSISSFTFKTHYCYYNNGKRFHGDCEADIRAAEKQAGHTQTLLHEQKYVCHNIQLDKQYQQQNYSFKNFHDHFFIVPAPQEIFINVFLNDGQPIPIFSCRGGPPLFTEKLRGPPLA